MWRLLKFLVWTGCAIGLGILLATTLVGGRTPVQHLQRAWKQHGFSSKIEELKTGVGNAVEDAKDSLTTALDKKPKERHSQEDREAVNKLVAKRNAEK